MTNYEKIKAMSAEKMAKAMGGHFDCHACPVFRICHSIYGKPCAKELEQWLLQEAEE